MHFAVIAQAEGMAGNSSDCITCRLLSVSSPALHVPRSLHKTIGDHAFPVVAAKSLEQAAVGDHVTVVFAHIQACIEDRTVPPILW